MNIKEERDALNAKLAELFAEAVVEASISFSKCEPAPILITGGRTDYICENGVFGSAYLKIDGRSKFAKWLRKNASSFASVSCYGFSIIPRNSSQSLARNEAWCAGFARVLKAHGVSSVLHSYLD